MTLIALVVAAALALVAYRSVLDLPLLGWDAFPLIAAGQLNSAADLWRVVSTELMGGRFPDGHYYRPLTALSFSLDEALYGLAPRGYHLTDLALLVINGALLAAVARRVFGLQRVITAVVAAALFVLHPIQLEVLPTVARRADALSLLGILALLCAQPRAEQVFGRRVGTLSFLLALAAASAKETGLLGPLLVASLHLFQGPSMRVPQHWLRVLRRTLPAALGALAYLGARTAVLGGLGGYAESGLGNLRRAPALAWDYAVRAIYPQPILGNDPAMLWGLGIVLALLFLAAIWMLTMAAPRRKLEATDLRQGAAVWLVWMISLLGISSLAGRLFDWYALQFAAPFALLVGLLIDRGFGLWREQRGRFGVPLWLVGVPLLASIVLGSKLVRPYRNLADAGALMQQTLQRLKRESQAAPDGTVVEVNPWVPLLAPHSDGSEVRSLALYHAYSLQAWFELTTPDREVEVIPWPGHAVAPKPGALRVVLIPGPRPAWIKHH